MVRVAGVAVRVVVRVGWVVAAVGAAVASLVLGVGVGGMGQGDKAPRVVGLWVRVPALAPMVPRGILVLKAATCVQNTVQCRSIILDSLCALLRSAWYRAVASAVARLCGYAWMSSTAC